MKKQILLPLLFFFYTPTNAQVSILVVYHSETGNTEQMAKAVFEGEPLKDKIGAVFVTAGGISAGEEIVQMNILQSMLVFGMVLVGGPHWTQPFGASAITGEEPFSDNSNSGIAAPFEEKGRALGERVAQLTLKFQ